MPLRSFRYSAWLGSLTGKTRFAQTVSGLVVPLTGTALHAARPEAAVRLVQAYGGQGRQGGVKGEELVKNEELGTENKKKNQAKGSSRYMEEVDFE